MNDPTIKVSLQLQGAVLNGYLTINPTASPESGAIQHHLDNLDEIIEHNSVNELLTNDCLDYVPLQAKKVVCTNWLCKISHGGKIVFRGLDIREVARIIYLGQIDLLNDGNALLYGHPSSVWNLKKGLLSVDELRNLVLSTGQFRVDSIKWNGPEYIATFIRN